MPGPVLDMTNPQEPKWRYTSGGGVVQGSVPCNCPAGAGQQTCLDDCHERAQEALDAVAVLFPEDV